MIQPIVLSVAAVALVALSTSVLIAALLWVLRPWLARITAGARARIALAAAVSPAVIGLSAVAAAHAPSMGLGEDHCFEHGAHHAHLCFEHTLGELGLVAWLVAALFAARLAVCWLRAGRSIVRSLRASRALCGSTETVHGANVVVDPTPHAFVLGYLRPRVFVTRALVEGPRDDLLAVLAHEQAHRRRRDPLRRLVARLCLPFHAPWLAGVVDAALGLAQEMAADEAAAAEVGDRSGVASAILHVARRRAGIPHGAAALGGADVVARVGALLDDRHRYDVPSARAVLLVALVVLACALALSEPLHHFLEHVLSSLV